MHPDIVFVGSPSLDIVSSERGQRASVGGAAFISALASRWSGASVGLVARVPPRLPAEISGVFGPGGLARRGLRTSDGHLPTFHIEYDDQHRAVYTHVDNGLERALGPQDVPPGWLSAGIVHLAPVGETARPQLDMLDGLRARGCRSPVSAGTYRRMIELDASSVRRLAERADLFFCNAEEFALLFSDATPADTTILVTDGGREVRMFRGGACQRFAVPCATVVDATGAGDAFCGGYLSCWSDPERAVAAGLSAAARVLMGVGAGPLMEDVARGVGDRVSVDDRQVENVATVLAREAKTAAFDFTQAPHLPVGHPRALAMFFLATMHQFGFWTADPSTGWQGPMYAELDGQRYKGSDFVWAAFARAARQHPAWLEPSFIVDNPSSVLEICTADDGRCPLPEPETYTDLHGAHAASMMRAWPGGYPSLVEACNAHSAPVTRLLEVLSSLAGYAEDPLRKKANLLALILMNRPERFLAGADARNIEPVVDYHLMRACLRTGCVRVDDPDLRRRLVARGWVDAPEEEAIRLASHRAISSLVALSGTSVAAVDGFFFALGRSRCIETEAPRCGGCAVDVCVRDTELFQPVFRTTAY